MHCIQYHLDRCGNDLYLSVGEYSFYIHRKFLSDSSTVFKALLDNEQGTIVIEENEVIDGDSMKRLLNILYYGEIKNKKGVRVYNMCTHFQPCSYSRHGGGVNKQLRREIEYFWSVALSLIKTAEHFDVTEEATDYFEMMLSKNHRSCRISSDSCLWCFGFWIFVVHLGVRDRDQFPQTLYDE